MFNCSWWSIHFICNKPVIEPFCSTALGKLFSSCMDRIRSLSDLCLILRIFLRQFRRKPCDCLSRFLSLEDLAWGEGCITDFGDRYHLLLTSYMYTWWGDRWVNNRCCGRAIWSTRWIWDSAICSQFTLDGVWTLDVFTSNKTTPSKDTSTLYDSSFKSITLACLNTEAL